LNSLGAAYGSPTRATHLTNPTLPDVPAPPDPDLRDPRAPPDPRDLPDLRDLPDRRDPPAFARALSSGESYGGQGATQPTYLPHPTYATYPS